MLYHIRIRGPVPAASAFALQDVVVVEEGDLHLLSCRVVDSSALTSVVAYLHDLGLHVVDLQAVEEPGSGDASGRGDALFG
ncbi:hypothetical protein [Cellulomonas sp. S1-8]|uniref:hypothetical protein n=1 Tax=Cellulomonas sp. S1-8 TaxID=2904790 RepID=UPI0022446EE0|nr:hypothetical protein [Cellulomonas sp. S1-8]UZN03085.1 hypothetical protein OKX07_18855 [Cellulomonas sp. S1-8]